MTVLFFLIVELESYTKRICHLSAARKKGRKNSVFWSGKNRIRSGKILLLTEVATLTVFCPLFASDIFVGLFEVSLVSTFLGI